MKQLTPERVEVLSLRRSLRGALEGVAQVCFSLYVERSKRRAAERALEREHALRLANEEQHEANRTALAEESVELHARCIELEKDLERMPALNLAVRESAARVAVLETENGHLRALLERAGPPPSDVAASVPWALAPDAAQGD